MTVPAPTPASDPAESGTDAMAAFAELGRINLSQADLSQVLQRVAELARDVIPGAVEVSVTLVSDGEPSTATFTGDRAMSLDETQYETGFGPCLSAAAERSVHVIEDMGLDGRWPAFTAAAEDLGVHSSLSVGIPVHEAVTGALNIYGIRPGAFDDEAVTLAQTFAGYAAVAMANAHLYTSTATLAAQMTEAMASRAVIEQAKGILIAQRGVSVEEAFTILARASQNGNRKLREVAQAIVDGAQRTTREN